MYDDLQTDQQMSYTDQPLAGVVLSCPLFKFTAALVDRQLVCLWQMGFLTLLSSFV